MLDGVANNDWQQLATVSMGHPKRDGDILFFVVHVADFDREDAGVALSQESRHIGHHHQPFLRDGGLAERTLLQVFCPGESTNVPLGQQVGRGERNLHSTILAAPQRRPEECQRAEVLPHM